MSSIQQLPAEILEKIFKSILGSPNQKLILLNCALVCQSWYLPACRALYEKIVILDKARMIYCLSRQRENLGNFCREIKLNDRRNLRYQRSCEQYDQLFTYLPNLQKITVGDQNTLNDLKHLTRNANKIGNLKELTITRPHYYENLAQAYYDCAFAFRQTLQHMNLTDLTASITANNGQNRPMYFFLPDFDVLTSIEIRNLSYGGIRQLSMFHILHLCPSLTKLIWINEYQEPIVEESNCGFDHSKLKKLEISLPTMISREIINSISEKMTGLAQLKISIKCYGTRSATWKVFDLNELHYLRSRLSNIETVDFIKSEDFARTINDYWSFVDANSSQLTHISMALVDKNITNSDSPIRLWKRGKYTSFHCEININEMDFWKNKDALIGAESPFLPSSLNSNRMIQGYEIHCSSSYVLLPRYKLFSNILPLVLESFPNIRFFNMTFYASPMYQFEAASNEIDYYNSSYSMSKLPTVVTPRHYSANSKHLAYLKLTNIQSPAEIYAILNLLPNTQYLTLFDSFEDLDENFNITLDLGAIHLKFLHLELTRLAMRYSGEHTIVLRIEEKDINNEHYYSWKRKDEKFTQMIFKPVSVDFLTKHGRFESKHCNIIAIKLNRVEKIVVSIKPDYYKKPIQTPLNLTPQ